jgi:hypothetical protein
VVAAAVAGDGTLAVALGDGSIRLIDPKNPSADPVVVSVHNGACLCLCADVDAKAFLSGGDDGRLARIDTQGTAEVLVSRPQRWIEHVTAHPASGVRVFASGKTAFVAERQRGGAAAPLRELPHSHSVGGLAINPKGKRLAVSHYGGVSVWWLAARESQAQSLEWKGSHLQVAWSPDGDYVMTAMQENALHGWRLSDKAHMRMDGYGAKVRSFSFDRRGQLFATGGADTVVCWPFSGGGPMGKPPLEFGIGPASPGAGTVVTAVACNPKSDVIAAGFANGAVILGHPSLPAIATVMGATGSAVSALIWSHDGQRLLAGTETGEVILADLRQP